MSIWETSKEEQEKIIEKVFGIIDRFDMGVPAVLLLESVKPLSQIGGAFAQMAIGPVFWAFWERGFDYIHTFEEMNNIEKLIKMIEEKHQEEVKLKEMQRKQEKKTPEENRGLIDKIKNFLK